MAAGCVVVFVTTYMLILPAITAEIGALALYDESVSSGGAVTPEEDTYIIEETSEAAYDETSEQTSEGETEETSEGETEEASTGETAEGTSEGETLAGETSSGGGSGSSGEPASEAENTEGETAEESTEVTTEGTLSELEITAENIIALLLGEEAAAEEGEGTYTATIKYHGSGDNESYNCEYDSETGNYSIDLDIDFVIYSQMLDISGTFKYNTGTSYYGYYTIDLPRDIILTDDILDGYYEGLKTGTSEVLFHLYFQEVTATETLTGTDSEGKEYTYENTYTYYQAVMGFFADQISENTGEITGTISVDAYIDSSAYNSSDGSLIVKDGDTVYIEIKDEDITYADDETLTKDISVSKSYSLVTDAEGNSYIEYTLKVYSRKGTGDTITLSDYFSDAFEDGVLGDLQSVTVSKGTATAILYSWGSDYGLSNETYETAVEMTTSEGSSSSGSAEYTDSEGTTYTYSYTYDQNGKLIITLTGLDNITLEDGYTYANEYVIDQDEVEIYKVTYKYSVSSLYAASSTGTNSVTASTTDETNNRDVSDSDSISVTISGKDIIDKSGSYSNGYITWTIVAGDGTASLNGYTLTDAMFAEAAEGITVTKSDGTAAVEGTDYSYVYTEVTNADGTVTNTITGIVFSSSDKTKYVITYKTAVSVWDGSYESNSATIAPPEGETTGGYGSVTQTDTAGVSVPSAQYDGTSTDILSKSLDEDSMTSSSGVYTFPWTVTLTIPSSGIPAGSEISDSLGGSYHYFTYDQAVALGELIHKIFDDGDTENVSVTFRTSSWSWIHLANLDKNTLYYAYTITFTNGVEYNTSLTGSKEFEYTENGVTAKATYDYENNTISVTYTSTGSVTDNPDSRTFSNTVTGGGDSGYDSWTYSQKVVKYGYNQYGGTSSSATSGLTTTDGTISWVVTVVLEPESTDKTSGYNSYKITDNLPAGVTLTKLEVSQSSNNSKLTLYDETNTGLSGTQSGLYDGYLNVSYDIEDMTNDSDGQQTIIISADYTDKESPSSITLSVIYTCQIAESYKGQKYSFENNVDVTAGTDTNYGSAGQTTSGEWTTTETESTVLSKDDYFDTNNNVIKYTVNVGGESYFTKTDDTEYYDDIVLTDVLSYKSYPTYGVVRSASLRIDSVKVYYDNSNLKYYNNDESSYIISGDELDSGSYSWTYDKETTTDWDGTETIVQTISLTLPNDGNKYVFVYEYKITIIVDSTYNEWIEGDGNTASGTYNAKAHATNYAYLTIDGEEIETTNSVETNDAYNWDAVSASASYGTGYSIYKVDADNFALRLSGATFDLYVYNADSTTATHFEKVTSITTDSNSTASISGSVVYVDDDTGAVYSSEPSSTIVKYTAYYRITDSGGEYVYIPIDTLCYFVESSAPTDYQLEGTKYYFYYGSNAAKILSNVTGYSEDVESAANLILGNTEYITNSHTAEYYSEKTRISVLKSWTDNENDPTDTYEKTDGSLKFKLYRILYDADTGEIIEDDDSTSSGSSGDSGSGDSGSGDSGGDEEKETEAGTFTYTVDPPYGSSVYSETVTYYESTQSVTFSVTDKYATMWGWYPTVKVTDGNGTQLAYTSNNVNSGTYSIEWTSDTASSSGTLSVTIPIDECKSGISIQICDDYSLANDFVSASAALSKSSVTVETTTETTTAEASSEATTQTTTETTTTVLYAHIFKEDEIETTTDDAGNYSVEKSDFGYDYVDYVKSTSVNFFTFNGALSDEYGDVWWNLSKYPSYTNFTLSRALKMESSIDGGSNDDSTLKNTPTQIKFNSEYGGTLTMVFTDGGTSVTPVDSVNIYRYINDELKNTYTVSASSHVISYYLPAGSYVIQRNGMCFVAFISFEEGAAETVDSSGNKTINFANGTSSDFFSVSGSTTTKYGTVNYYNYVGNTFTSATALKMNSAAKITFTTENSGTLYFVFTNAAKYASPGAKIDGTDHIAADTGADDTSGYSIYTLSTRVEAGSHTIARIGSTEYMLYYIQFIPDDFGSGEWLELADCGVKGLGDYVSSFVISASNNWTWTSDSLPSQKINTETGAIVGYYKYYVIEDDVTDPNDSSKNSFYTLYLNNEGISAGTIKVSNRINPDTSGAVSLSIGKVWLDEMGTDVTDKYSKSSDYSIDYILYKMVKLFDSSSTEGGTYATSFYKGVEDGFFTHGASNSYTTGDAITYNGTSYATALKTESATSVKFKTKSYSGTLKLIFDDDLPADSFVAASLTSSYDLYVTADGSTYYQFTDHDGSCDDLTSLYI
ncbi:MAG: hypothetical protein LUD81_11025, partial [Clostridiales bacterium]|nr:hypothetical protein [Clostridiales bacterium]